MRRDEVAAFARKIVDGALRFGIEGNSLIRIPGPPSKNGSLSDSLEGFARTFLLYSFLSAGDERCRSSFEAEWFVQGLEQAAKRSSWPALDQVGQARVEAALIALGLDIARSWIWNELTSDARDAVICWMAPAVGDATYPQKNWVWFRLIVETFLRSVGGPHSMEDMHEDLCAIDSFYQGHGWYSDGHQRAYDHYVGWAFHVYPTLWSRMAQADDLAVPRRDEHIRRLDCYVSDLMHLVGGNGSPLIQGRSLIYRFATAAPFCAAALESVPSVPMGDLRRAALSILGHFIDEPIFGESGYLTLGWCSQWPKLAQRYSGPGSPYWASKGLMCLMLPESHPFWSAGQGLLPVERGDHVLVMREPGWLVSSTCDDGIVRVYNYGADHAREGIVACDSPLYARWSYSTHTSPMLDEESWLAPKDASSVIVLRDGSRTHRTGWRRLEACETGSAFVAGAICTLSIVLPNEEQKHHGAGYVGEGWAAGKLVSASVVRGKWEVRIDYVFDVREGAECFEASGWTVPYEVGESGTVKLVPEPLASVVGGGLHSRIIGCYRFYKAGCRQIDDASPMADCVGAPFVESSDVGGLHVSALFLGGAHCAVERTPCVSVVDEGLDSVIEVDWGDGHRSVVDLRFLVGA